MKIFCWTSNLDSVWRAPIYYILINFIIDASFLSFPPMSFYPISCIDMYRMETKGWICKYEIYKIKNLGWNVWGWSFQAPSVRYMYHQSQMRACGMYCMQVSCVPAGQKKLSLYEIFSCNVVTKKQEKYVFL